MKEVSHPRRRVPSYLLATIAIVLASCGGPAVKENLYTLSAPPTTTPAASASSASIYVGPVSVPEAVDRLPMVLRTSPNQVELSESHRWAEPLKSAIPRVLAETLMRELGTARVMSARQGATLAVDYRVAVEVQRFDSSLDQGATIEALWTITPAKGNVRSGRSTVVEPAPSRDPAGLAAAHSRALERIARDIAAAIRN